MPKQLYLLEVLVHDVLTETKRKCSQLKVEVKFLSLPLIPITPCGDAPSFGGGKSCIFSMRPADMSRDLPTTPVVVAVLEDGDEVGRAHLSLGHGLRETAQQGSAADLPARASVRGTHPLLHPVSREPVGKISLLVRLSCYGRFVVSELRLQSKEFELVEVKKD